MAKNLCLDALLWFSPNLISPGCLLLRRRNFQKSRWIFSQFEEKLVGEMNSNRMKRPRMRHLIPAAKKIQANVSNTGKKFFFQNLISDEVMIVQILFGLTLGICLMITLSACLVKRVPGKIVSVDGWNRIEYCHIIWPVIGLESWSHFLLRKLDEKRMERWPAELRFDRFFKIRSWTAQVWWYNWP